MKVLTAVACNLRCNFGLMHSGQGAWLHYNLTTVSTPCRHHELSPVLQQSPAKIIILTLPSSSLMYFSGKCYSFQFVVSGMQYQLYTSRQCLAVDSDTGATCTQIPRRWSDREFGSHYDRLYIITKLLDQNWSPKLHLRLHLLMTSCNFWWVQKP